MINFPRIPLTGLTVLMAFVCDGCIAQETRATVPTPLPAEPEVATAQKGDPKRDHLLKLVYDMDRAYSRVKSYSATFVKQERIGRRLLPEERMSFRFREPFDIAVEYTGTRYKGRKAVYCKGKNDGKVLGKARIFFKDRIFRIDPDGRLARMGNRHPVTDAGIGSLVDLLVRNARRAEEAGELELVDHGEQTVNDRPARVIEGILPKDRSNGYYCWRTVVAIDRENGLPIQVKVYMWDEKLYERYEYRDLELNPEIGDDVFELSGGDS